MKLIYILSSMLISIPVLAEPTANDPTVTDWITAIGTLLGIPALIWGILQLFRKDKKREEDLKFVQDQLNEMRKQTSSFQSQTELMKGSNTLIERQINLQAAVYLESAAMAQKSIDLEQKKLEIEHEKRVSEMKPYFVYDTAFTGPDSFVFTVRNNGARAFNLKVSSRTEFINLDKLNANLKIGRGEDLRIRGYANAHKTHWNAHSVIGDIALEFTDEESRGYVQILRKNREGYFQIDAPVLVGKG